jgi:hypothetical protein
MNELRDDELLGRMIELREKDVDGFMQLVLTSLKAFPETAVDDVHPVDDKLGALKILLRYFEEKEDYEDCAFLRDLSKLIEDAEKRQVSGNE